MELQSHCERRFDALDRAFRENFLEHGEVGARATVIQDGATVFDRWGGFRDAARTLPWREDTLVCTMSVAKGYTVFANPEHRLGFAYTPNRFTSGEGLGEESRRLVDALYACL